MKRTLIILIETEVEDCLILSPHTVKTLREYADALEGTQGATGKRHKNQLPCSGLIGDNDAERWQDSSGNIVRVFHYAE
jgi:hypothetical protein